MELPHEESIISRRSHLQRQASKAPMRNNSHALPREARRCSEATTVAAVKCSSLGHILSVTNCGGLLLSLALVVLLLESHIQLFAAAADQHQFNFEALKQATDGPTLALSIDGGSDPEQGLSGSEMMQRIASDQYDDDFKMTVATINQLGGALEEFVQREQVPTDQSNIISHWLNDKATAHIVRNPLTEKIARELDFVYGNYWSNFRPLIETIITERPSNFGPNTLAFRCERYDELRRLKELSLGSAIFGILHDIFASELYCHCLLRKLAMIGLQKALPSPVVRQFDELALSSVVVPNGMMASASLSLGMSAADWAGQLGALASRSRLEQAAGLVLDANSDKQALVEKFRQECQKHTTQLAGIWSTFDELASFLSSSTNDLASFNGRVKFVAPQLKYGAICSQLAQMTD